MAGPVRTSVPAWYPSDAPRADLTTVGWSAPLDEPYRCVGGPPVFRFDAPSALLRDAPEGAPRARAVSRRAAVRRRRRPPGRGSPPPRAPRALGARGLAPLAIGDPGGRRGERRGDERSAPGAVPTRRRHRRTPVPRFPPPPPSAGDLSRDAREETVSPRTRR